MTTERPQAGAEAPGQGAPAGSDTEQPEAKASRVKEFMASLQDPVDVAEFRKLTRELLEPDFKAQDAKHQRRTAAEKRRADEAEALLRDSADPETVERLKQEKGSLERAKERAIKTGRLPQWAARNVRSFDDLWEAEDDFAKNGGGFKAGVDGEESAPAGEDAEFVALLKRHGIAVPGAETARRQPLAPTGGGVQTGPATATRDDLKRMSPQQYKALRARGLVIK